MTLRMSRTQAVLVLLLFGLCWMGDAVRPMTPARTHIYYGWTAVIPAIISAIGAWQASKQAKKKSGPEKDTENLLLEQLKQLMPFGQQMMQQGSNASGQALNFFNRTARNPRESITPELNDQARADRSTMSAMGEMPGRGGSSADVLARLPFQRSGQTTNMLFSARRGAYDSLGQMGQNLMSTGLNAASGGRAGGGALLNFGLDRSRQAFDQGSQAGSSIYQIVKGITDSYNRGKGTGTGQTSGSVWEGTGFGGD